MAVKNLKDAIRERTTPAKGQAYAVGTDLLPAAELPAQAGALSEPLQVIARNYIGARHRHGEALLDAARWLSEARTQAKHTEWQIFLQATSTSADVAEGLLNMHTMATRDSRFAEAVRSSWLTQSTAMLLARKSTPEIAIKTVLELDTPATVKKTQQIIREAKGNKTRDVTEFDNAPAPPEPRGFGKPAEPQAHEVWRDALSQLRGAKAQARAVQLQARHFVGQQRRTLLEEIESLQKGLEAARKALEASL